MEEKNSRRRRKTSDDNTNAKKPKPLSERRSWWIQVYPANQEVSDSVSSSGTAERLRKLCQATDFYHGYPLSNIVPNYSIATGKEYPSIVISAVCCAKSEDYNPHVAALILKGAIGRSTEAPHSLKPEDFKHYIVPLPPSYVPQASVKVMQWFKVSAPPLTPHFLEQAIREELNDPDIEFNEEEAEDASETNVLVLMPPQSAADLMARGLCLVRGEPNRAEYRIAVSAEAVEGPVIAPPAWTPLSRIPKDLPMTTSKHSQTDITPIPPIAQPAPKQQQQQPKQRRRRRRKAQRLPEQLVQCYKCQLFGHRAAACEADQDVCRVCAGNHRSKDCQRHNDLQCSNCLRANHPSSDHRSSSRRCPNRPKAPPVASSRPPRSTWPKRGRGLDDCLQHLVGPLLKLLAAINALPKGRLKPPPNQRGRRKPRA